MERIVTEKSDNYAGILNKWKNIVGMKMGKQMFVIGEE